MAKVGEQSGVSDAVGGLSLQVLKVSGQFTRGQFQQDGGGGELRRGGGDGGPQGGVQGGGADFDVNSYSVYGTDVTEPGLGPLTSSEITSGRTFRTTETNAKVAVADSAYAKEKKYTVGSTVTIKDVTFRVIGIATADSGDPAADLYLPLRQAQTLSDAKNKVTTIYVKATDSQRIDGVKAEIQKNVLVRRSPPPPTSRTPSPARCPPPPPSPPRSAGGCPSRCWWPPFLGGRPAHLLGGLPPGPRVRHAEGAGLESRAG